MGTPIRVIDVKEEIFSDNKHLADEIRHGLAAKETALVNIMGSPGAGKTSLILETIRRLQRKRSIGVIEADIESVVDSERVRSAGIPVVQIHTGGACHVDASMVKLALESPDFDGRDLVLLENVGNLVCPAEFDTGATSRVVVLSVPEGDDKPLKYPLMFSVSDVLVINKIDYLSLSDFDLSALKRHVLRLNPDISVFEVSCKTGEGFDAWCAWLLARETAATGNSLRQ
jgi:hydrogenase nickel incorporation protein HypB